MIKLSRIKVFVINLDRSTQRLAAIQAQLAPTQLEWQRVPAVDGRAIDVSSLPEVDEATYRRWQGKPLNPGQVGCYLSHIAVMRKFLESDSDFALVLEDDASLPPDFVPLLQRLLELGKLWDVVKLSRIHSGIPVTLAKLTGSYRLAVPLGRHCNSNSLLLNRRAAQTLCERLLPMRLPYDHAIERSWLYGLRLRVVSPAPCLAETGQASTIAENKSDKFVFYKRIHTLLYRSRTELLRVVYGMLHVTRFWLFGN
ncbi:MAG: glycosyltransferase family 25 protein [Verrucomicrobia bacterium]|nr:glycosyltransferase family 25 protein [Verrucomicrobiota bacterium]